MEDRTREFDTGAVYRVSDYLLAYHPYLDNEARDPEQYYDDEEAFHRSCWQHFRLPRWKDQPKHVEVWLEKQALSALFQQVTKELEVPFAACRGYPSLTYLHEGFQRLRSVDKERIILYFGDYDPSGEDIQSAIGDRLKDLASTSHVDIRKIAITRDQIQQYQIPPMPTKAKDPRRNRFVAQHGDVAVELDVREG